MSHTCSISGLRDAFSPCAHVPQLQEEDSLAAGERALLMELAEGGPQTVSDMARARPVSRHTVQVLVNGLLRRSLARLGEHPRSQRAKLVLLTSSGKALRAPSPRPRGARAGESLAQQLTGADVKRAGEVPGATVPSAREPGRRAPGELRVTRNRRRGPAGEPPRAGRMNPRPVPGSCGRSCS